MATKKTATTKAVTKKQTAALANVPDYGGDAGTGTEGFDEDRVLRFIKLLQTQSPEVLEGGDGYVEGARPGMFYNPASGDLYDKLHVNLFARDRHFNEWIKLDEGGGFVQRLEVNDPRVAQIMSEAKQQVGRIPVFDEPTHELVESVRLGVVICDPEKDWEPVDDGVFVIERTKFPPYKALVDSLMKARAGDGTKIWGRAPVWAYRIEIGSELESKPKIGSPYYKITMTPAIEGDVTKSLLPVDHPLYLAAKQMLEQMSAGAVRMATAEEEGREAVEDAEFEVVNDGSGSGKKGQLPF